MSAIPSLMRGWLLPLGLLCILLFPAVPVMAQGSDSVPHTLYIRPSDLQGNGESVYRRLVARHREAMSLGRDTRVVYPRGRVARMTIPADAAPIPLTAHTDFGGCTFEVENQTVDHLFLFSMDARDDLQDDETIDIARLAQARRRVQVTGETIDRGDFTAIPALARGEHLLYIYDPRVWSVGGVSGNLQVFRRDVIYVIDGRAQNAPIQPYAASDSLLCFYDDVKQHTAPAFEHLTFNRAASSTCCTYLFRACGQVGLQVRDIAMLTPPEDTTRALRPAYIDDRCIYVRHSVNTLLEDIHVDGTYSARHAHGYAFRLINLARTTLRRVTADGSWGINCGFYLGTVTLDACMLNRFDCHCYCAHFTFNHCTFRTDLSRYSSDHCCCTVTSAFGQMVFSHCRFVYARPLIVSPMYSGAFSGFDLAFRDCLFDVLPRYYYLVEGLRFDRSETMRSLPNLTLSRCTFRVSQGLDAGRIYLFHFNNQKNDDLYDREVGTLHSVILNRVRVLPAQPDGKPVPVWLCNKRLTYRRDMHINIHDCTFDEVQMVEHNR